jgi:hypothetical protein
MTQLRLAGTLLVLLSLAACSLEVEQHPPWIDGEYNNKRDNLHQQAYFHNDRLAWNAAIDDRNRLQNEYGRTRP